MIRHSYVNCATCHVSPAGGGLLTEYGRELSQEELSAAGAENENRFLYQAIKPPAWLNMGGDLRTLVLYRDSPSFREGRAILMQADVEAAVTHKNVAAVVTAGYRETAPSRPNDSHFISRRHYLRYQPVDEITLRLGKFNFAYGINTPDHAITIKRGLGWDQGSETYNFEGAYSTERWGLFVTGILGRPDDLTLGRESGFSTLVSVSPIDNARLGMSYFYGKNTSRQRSVLGPHALIALSKQWVLLSELDFQLMGPSSTLPAQQGFVNYQKLDFEFIRGLHAFLTQELSVQNFTDHSADYQVYGIGLQVFPRPHLEASLTYQRSLQNGVNEGTDLLFLQMHLYL